MEDRKVKVIVLGKLDIKNISKESMDSLCKVILEAYLFKKQNNERKSK